MDIEIRGAVRAVFDELRPSMKSADLETIASYIEHDEIGLALDDLHAVAADVRDGERQHRIEDLASRIGHPLAAG